MPTSSQLLEIEPRLPLQSHSPLLPVKAGEVEFTAELPAFAVFVGIIRSVLTHVSANLAPTRSGEPEGLHQLRIGLRRLRAALQFFRPLLHREALSPFTSELRRIGQVFGAARDCDVFLLETLRDAAIGGVHSGDIDLLREQAERHRSVVQSRLRFELDGAAFAELLNSVAGWVEETTLNSGLARDDRLSRPIVEVAPALINRVARRVAKDGRHLERASDEALHELRKSIKKLRYAIEFMAPLYPRRRVKALVDACKELQELLGTINDAVTAPALARQLSGGQPEFDAAITALSEWTSKRARKALKRLPRKWQKLWEVGDFWN